MFLLWCEVHYSWCLLCTQFLMHHFTFLSEMSQASSDPVNVCAEPIFVSWLAVSFSSVPLCPDTQSVVHLPVSLGIDDSPRLSLS
jgi:hypothetical protein